jgi:hypothetical protein
MPWSVETEMDAECGEDVVGILKGMLMNRGVWRSLVTVPDLESGDRRFESCHPDCGRPSRFVAEAYIASKQSGVRQVRDN